MLQINGNLDDKEKGLKNYTLFQKVILEIWIFYLRHTGMEAMDRYPVYVDNATSNSGHTPIITAIFGKYLHIKLCVSGDSEDYIIAFQFSHELMHYLFYVWRGIEKPMADEQEEAVCTAASLIIIRELYSEKFSEMLQYVAKIENPWYRKGIEIAIEKGFDFDALLDFAKE